MDNDIWLPRFDVSAENDDELLDYFFQTNFIDDLLKSKKWMVLGRKGTGKTAIYQYLKSLDNPKDKFNIIPLNFKEYPWPIHSLYKENMEGFTSTYSKSWKYLFIINSVSKLINIQEKEGNLNKELKDAKKVLETIYGNPTPSITEVIKSKIGRIKELKLPSVDLGDYSATLGELSFDEISISETLKSQLRINAFQLLSYFEKIFLNNSKERIFIILDQLDENWISHNINEYSNILINLINISNNINSSNEFKNRLKIIVFLRSDIYSTLIFNDKNKILEDGAITIQWDFDALNDMFFERIKKFKPIDLIIEPSEKSNCVFVNKNVRRRSKPINHIINRTFYRPRDLISYFNKIRECHHNKQESNNPNRDTNYNRKISRRLYTNEDIYEADHKYSVSLYEELLDEWVNQKPDIKNYLSILQNIGLLSFDYTDYSNTYLKIYGESSKADIENSLDFLFQNSIIGQKYSNKYIYSCMKPNILIDINKPFHVNEGLKSKLKLTENRTSRDLGSFP
ncbi:P-loop ATPase, Sll1717 family [uncultured Methanospirillum sp.]|uniref:P-loop ATPase, Sll1717 family n=1 Tax=uncultured Methanospirillum sp. TaxID=262503 RepID=UPI0029C777FF|nr:hypothetical protein [uncultured Methanospirillum sp.]